MNTQQEPAAQSVPKRTNADYLGPSRWESVSHLKTELKKKPTYSAKDFLGKMVWNWIYHYIKSRFGKKFPYPTYDASDSGVYKIAAANEEAVRIGIASDWATDTDESFAIAERMASHDPHFTIHVGDTYYVGAPHEIRSNFTDKGAPWYKGSAGSFVVLGNHEMYAKGDAFFETLLPAMGMRKSDGSFTGQKAGFFCLENEYWRILGLDTGYHSVGKPLLEFLPFFKPDCKLDEKLVDWLVNTVKLNDAEDKRGILLLTHHQFISAFNKESEYMKPASQLGALLGTERKVLWLWGHEHKLSFFAKTQIKDSPQVYGRCIGFGGTPVEIGGKGFQLSTKLQGYDKLVAVDRRRNKRVEGVDVGFNGYAVAKLRDSVLAIEYHDSDASDRDHPGPLVVETWRADLATGDIQGTIQECKKGLLTFAEGKTLADAVRP
ncbi:MAG: metallophosphoesterase [Bacteroidota bacterium]|nr:metallophosphoesterase [Bacteroidota bacterium]